MDIYLLPIYIFIFVLGLVVGSFLNVCILRIPAGESIVVNSSHCMSCGKKLHWYELIPVVSWLVLRGKCSVCKKAISIQYPLIELANGMLWLLVFMKFEFTADTILGCLLVSVLIVAAMIDARTRELPLVTTMFVAGLGVIRMILNPSMIKTSLLGMLVIGGFLFLLLLISGGTAIGGGDVKLMAGAGLFLGLVLNVFAFFTGCILGSVIHIIRMKYFGAKRDLAMGPYLAAGIIFALLWGQEIISWYLGLLMY